MMADTVSLKLELHDAFSAPPARGQQRATAAPPQHDAQCCSATCEKVVLAEVEQQQKILVLLFRVPRCIRCAIFHVAATYAYARTHAHARTLSHTLCVHLACCGCEAGGGCRWQAVDV
eukprot:COSAG01_NODE_30173_length_621_cov_1.118774_1_plen_117_part_10